MKTEIKICGLTNTTEAEWVVKAHAEYAGMVLFFESSKRNVSIQKASEMIQRIRCISFNEKENETKTVAVCVSPTISQALEIERLGFDFIQIHGKLESEIFSKTTLPIIRAINNMDAWEQMKEVEEDPQKWERIYGILFDAKTPGSGKKLDLELLKNNSFVMDQNRTKKFFLAGGLRAENVRDAIQQIVPDVVDVSSGVEMDASTVGKSHERIIEFVKQVRN